MWDSEKELRVLKERLNRICGKVGEIQDRIVYLETLRRPPVDVEHQTRVVVEEELKAEAKASGKGSR